MEFVCTGHCTDKIGEHDHCKNCSHANFIFFQDYEGKRYRFSFNPHFGPMFLDKNGNDLKKQPMYTKKSKRWQAFEKWFENYGNK